MERKLVVGIRDFCILSSWKACLEGNEKEKLTREVLSVLMVAQKSTRRRVEWIKWGLFTLGFFVWSTPHCTVCPARWLVSSSSVCNPSSDPFVKSHRSPSSFTPWNIFLGISLPKTEQKDHFSCQFFNISNPQSDGCGGITWPSSDSPLERTSEGNSRVQDVDQVQNPTKNPFTNLMSTVKFFKLQMIHFVVYYYYFLINS